MENHLLMLTKIFSMFLFWSFHSRLRHGVGSLVTREFHIYNYVFCGRDLIVLTDELLLREEEPMLNISDLAYAFNITYLRCYWCFSRPWQDWSESILEYHYSFLPEYSHGTVVYSCPSGSNWLFKYEVHKNILSGCFSVFSSVHYMPSWAVTFVVQCCPWKDLCHVVNTVSPGTGRDLRRVLQSIY